MLERNQCSGLTLENLYGLLVGQAWQHVNIAFYHKNIVYLTLS
jgi:hypothetical protein